MAIQSNSDQGATVPEDPILRIVKEQNSAMFTAAKEAVRQRILREALREAVAELGRPDAIAEQALELVDDTHETLHTAVDELKQRLIEKVAHRSMQDLADAEATARQARACIEENHEAILEARRLLKRHLLGEIIQRSTDELADPQAAAHVAKALIRDDNPSVLGAVDGLKQHLIAEIVQRSTDELADAEAVARRAHALIMISPEHEVILAAVDKLKEQILQTIVRESLTKINDEVGGTSRPTGPPEARPDGPAEPYVTTPQALKLHLHGLDEAAAQSRSRGPDAPASPPKMQRRKAANGYPEDQEIPPEAAPSAHLAQAHYVHGIVAHRGRGLIEALAAIDSETIYRPYVIPFKTVAAVASRVPGALTENDGWKALKGVQAGLLEHLSQKGAAVLPMYAETLYASEADLVAILAAHAHTLEVHLGELSGKQEWAVKIYCDPERIKQEVHSTDASIDAFLGQILVDVHEWSARGPAEELKALQEGMDLSLAELLETVQLNCQQGVHRALQGISEDSRLASSSEEEPVFGQSRMVLSASYLVAESEAEAFRAELERLAAEYERLGLVYYIGGPHPPCRFTVRGAPEL